MNGTTVVPGDVFDKIKGKDITLNFDMGDGISWIVNGKDVITDNVVNIDFGVKKGGKNIPVDVVNNITGEHYSMQLSLAYEGEFGFTAVLSVNLGKSNAGYIASLYYYDSASGELELICKAPISKDGNADLRFTHASDYLIVIDEKSDDETSDNTDDSKLDNESTPDDSENTDANPNTGDPNYMWIIIFSLLLSVSVIGILVAERKKHI